MLHHRRRFFWELCVGRSRALGRFDVTGRAYWRAEAFQYPFSKPQS